MKLGTQTASLVNHLQSRAVIGQPEPVVGMGATILGWSDRHPATVVETFTAGKFLYIVVQADNYKRVDKNGMSECQDYEFTPNLEGSKTTYRRGADGKWQGVYKNPESGRWIQSKGNGLRIGERDKYHDFSF